MGEADRPRKAMKKKIVFGLSIFAMMFFLGGVYIVKTMETTVSELRSLADLHHNVAFRKELLTNIEKIQNNIKLKGTRYAENMAATLYGGRMREAVQRCLICHHPPQVAETPLDLKNQIEQYVALTQSLFAADPGAAVPAGEAAVALRMGENLTNNVEGLISTAGVRLAGKEQSILNRVKLRKNFLFLMVTVGPFFAVGFAFILISGIAKPVRSLLDATRRIKSGDLDHRIVGLNGEFGEVADSFNEMAASLKTQMQEMQRTEQLKVFGEMAAGLAHEIRNPLAGIKVSMEVLLSDLQLEERDKLVLAKVIEEIRHIELLMKNILNFARPVAAQPTLVDINQLLGKTIDFINNHPSFSAPDARRKIVQDLAPDLPDTSIDPQQLKQVFLNLFLNAADALPDGGAITVRTRNDEPSQTIVIQLQDTGKGIPAELIDKVFQPFFTTKVKGTGLGLAVSKRLVEDNGGNIKVNNNVSGGGVTFTITLPAQAAVSGVAK
jgi:signal transduction histidine kinase